ncbi:Eco57I restriction-modification methylase domain-containing protein [Kaistella solincola]|uniref:Eco57I restriction-modification methylase domain-containing protein n=1 Tax=Kaistella solincola TaxID=510955 RepID=UPI00068A6B08|nr:N-6 DNA methylase [Kaistella solincola]
MKLQIFNQVNFLQALKALFKDLKVPMNYVADEPTTAKEILKDTYKDNDTFQLMDDVYFLGMVDDASFEGNKSLEAEKIKSDYDGILIFGVTLKSRPNGLLPTRSQLAEISRAFNREFYYTPVVVVFKYGYYLAFANTERLKYKQEWREGEKAGKVSLLRDIHIEKPHSGHERILAELQIPTTGTKKVDSFAKLYAYWQEVFSVSLLNKKFYQELSNWYFWATQHVTFPGEPTIADAHHKNAKLEDLLQEHRATNVIRMLTRLLFVWFIKEKKLIPEELFELDALQKDILNEISPYHERGMFKERNKESIYYKAILQNLFFATLNCPIEAESLDKRKRGFRGDGYGTHRGIDYLMRYKSYFKNPDAFLEKLNQTVPFLNGGLFECLDDKFNNLYIDGFSDQMTKGEQLIVPDYLFFGVEEETDLSDIVGIKDKKYKQAAVKGLINILKSYKFTITENTPIEEDVALDPELLGKVFENLLASYNPETKTTARKQTGSFYTPREIVNYMVDESLIAYLKNAISDWGGLDDKTLDKELHVLTSFDSKVPFADNPRLQKEIITALSTCTILDPACGSGAFPMGILQKMVHILQKLDPDNKVWKEVQLEKAEQDSKAAFEIEDKQAREERLLEINEAFDQSINDPDYARKLFLIENCIYGVDIQPIATQISKLRFFISLVVEQKVNAEKNNFGIRPLPNLETKFVAANTLIGIKKDGGLFETDEVKKVENELKIVRHKIFSLKSKERKIAWREKDKVLREKLSTVLKNQGLPLDAAEKLAGWDPYDQNASSPFFDSEWMFGIKDGFEIVIGNPPYLIIPKELLNGIYKEYKLQEGKPDLYRLFLEKSAKMLTPIGIFSFITPNTFLTIPNSTKLRKYILTNFHISSLLNFDETVFETASVNSLVFVFDRKLKNNKTRVSIINSNNKTAPRSDYHISQKEWEQNTQFEFNIFINDESSIVITKIEENSKKLNDFGFSVSLGAQQYHNTIHSESQIQNRFLHSEIKLNHNYILELGGKNINLFKIDSPAKEIYVDFSAEFYTKPDKSYFTKPRVIFREITGKTIISAYTEKVFVISKSCYSIIGKPEKLKNLQLILSSRLIGYWVSSIGDKSKQRLFPRITKSAINKIPVKLFPNTNFACNLHDMIAFSSNSSRFAIFRNIQDGLVFNLYFKKHVDDLNLNVIEMVENDVTIAMQGSLFEHQSQLNKEQIVESLYAKWSHPDNEVRNRIKLFAVRSPEILKPILES